MRVTWPACMRSDPASSAHARDLAPRSVTRVCLELPPSPQGLPGHRSRSLTIAVFDSVLKWQKSDAMFEARLVQGELLKKVRGDALVLALPMIDGD